MDRQLGKTVRGHLPNVFVIQPLQLIHVEAGVMPEDLRKIKNLDDLLDGKLLAVVLGRPAEQAEIIHDRFRSETLLHIVAERSAEGALAHLSAVLIEYERNVAIVRRLHTK